MDLHDAQDIVEDLAVTTDGNHLSEREREAIKTVWQHSVDTTDTK